MKREKKRNIVLVPYNFSETAQIALENAIHIAHCLNAEIHLLTIVPSADFFTELFRKDRTERRILRETKNQLKEVATKTIEKSGLKVSIIVEKGKWEEVILETAAEIKAQYIIMGKLEVESNKFFFFNNKDIPVIAKSPCPVIITNTYPISNDGFKNIVLPLDLTKETSYKIRMAITWAKYYKATIHLVGVLSVSISSKNSRLYTKMQEAQYLIESEGITCTNEIYQKSDKPIDEVILEHAVKVKGDILMIMTHQEMGVLDTYIGEVAQNMIRNSRIPVVSYTSAAMDMEDHILMSILPLDFLKSKKTI